MGTRSAQKNGIELHGFPELDGGLPLIGHLGEMYKRFPDLCARGARAHGRYFWINAGPGSRQLMCADPSALAILKHGGASSSFYTERFEALLGNTLFAFDGDEHRRARQPITPPFTPQRVRGSDVVRIVVEAVSSRVETWIDKGAFDVVAETREIALEIIFRMIGVPPTRLAEWRTQYNRYLLAALPSSGTVRGPLYHYAKRGRDWIDAQLGAIVDSLRASEETTTLAGAMANGRDDEGRLLDRGLVVSNLRLLIFAGHETTASGIAWSTLHLATSSELQRRLVVEAGVASDPAEAATDLSRFTFAERMFREAIRLYAPVHSVLRRLTTPLEIDGVTLPAGLVVALPFIHWLRDPARFVSPGRFDPERLHERPRPGTLETAMFGAGPHFCLGYHVAVVEGTLFNLLLGRAMRSKGLELRPAFPGPVPPPLYLPLVHPPRGLKVELAKSTRRSLPDAHP